MDIDQLPHLLSQPRERLINILLDLVSLDVLRALDERRLLVFVFDDIAGAVEVTLEVVPRVFVPAFDIDNREYLKDMRCDW